MSAAIAAIGSAAPKSQRRQLYLRLPRLTTAMTGS